MTGFIRPCSDTLFKYIFADPIATRPLRSFLTAALDWNETDLTDLTIENPQLDPTHTGDKQSILDVRVTTRTGDSIDIEIQLNPSRSFPERLAFYTARLLTAQIHRGQGYNQLERAICVGITDFTLITDDDYHHRFKLYDPTRQIELTDTLQVDLLELPKLPAQNDNTLLWHWLRFISARNQEELNMTATADPAIAEAVDKVHFFTAEEQAEINETRELMWMMEQTDRRREALEDGEAKGARETQLEVARRMIARGMPADIIAEITQLSADEIAALLAATAS